MVKAKGSSGFELRILNFFCRMQNFLPPGLSGMMQNPARDEKIFTDSGRTSRCVNFCQASDKLCQSEFFCRVGLHLVNLGFFKKRRYWTLLGVTAR